MKNIVLLISLLLIACEPIDNKVFLDDFIAVQEPLWLMSGNVNPYPFATKYGHIACSENEVYYFPDDTASDESKSGLPLNKLAQLRLRQAHVVPNIENAILPNADLSEAIKIGLDHCQKVKAQFADSDQ